VSTRDQTLAILRATRAAGIGVPRRTGAGQFHPGHSGNPSGRPRGHVPRAAPTTLIVNAYARALLARVARMREAYAPVFEALPALIAAAKRAVAHDARADGDEQKRASELLAEARARVAAASAQPDIAAIARRFAAETSTHQRVAFNAQTRAALGVEVHVADRKVVPIVDAFVDANVGLIKNIGDRLAADVEAAVHGAFARGDLAPGLEGALSALGFAETRARRIARDQIGKLNGQIGAARQREIGATRFRWRTSRDKRVRGNPDGLYPKAKFSHWDLEGKVFEYANPPEGLLPGEDFECRCYPEAYFDDLLDELNALD
jgi:SPP1 gp7 family putative phage head morphogenesis protein